MSLSRSVVLLPLSWILSLGLCAGLLQPAYAGDEEAPRPAFEKRATEYGQALAREIEGGRLDLFRRTFDAPAYIERAIDGLLLSTEERAQIPRMLTVEALWDPVLSALRKGLGSFQFVGLRRIDGETVALFRLTALPNIILWQGVLVREDRTGSIRAVDLYGYMEAMWRSAVVRHELVANIPGVDPDPDPLRVRHAKDYAAATRRFLQGKYEAGEAAWKRLPEALRRERFLMRWRIAAAFAHGKAAYAQTIHDYRKAHPKDPYTTLREKDLAYLEKRWDDMLVLIEALDAYVGGDPYINAERAVVFQATGRHAEAAAALDAAIHAVGPLHELVLMRALCALHMSDFPQAVEMFRKWEAITGQEVGLSARAPNVEAFRSSEAYRNWRGPSTTTPKAPGFKGDALAFAQALEEELLARKLTLFLGSFDHGAMADRAVDGLKLTAKDREAAHRTISTNPGLKQVTERLLRMALSEGGRFHLLGVRKHRGRATAVYRVAGHGMTVWFGFNIVRGSDGVMHIADVFNFANGAWFSEGLRREVLFNRPYAAGEDAQNLRAFKATYDRMLSAFGDLRYEEGMQHYLRLPASWQRRRHILEARVHGARLAGPKAYEEALTALLENHPRDVGVRIKAVALEFVRKRYDAALAAIDRLEEAIGEDLFLDVRRAEVHVRAGRTAKARGLAESFLQAEGPLADALIVLAECAVTEGDFQQAVKHYGRASTMRSNPITPSAEVPRAKEFLASKEYKRWQARLELLRDR